MWRMLCSRSQDLLIEFEIKSVSDSSVSVVWSARYTFKKTGRSVHNIVSAQLRIENGKIVEHVDSFNFLRWSRQALGWVGWCFGWTRCLRRIIRIQALNSLRALQRSSLVNYPEQSNLHFRGILE